jgi:hypothetical protein
VLRQQGWFFPPQAPQLPLAAQVPAPAHDWAAAMHWVLLLAVRVQQPLVHRLPGQQGPPATPHFWQTAVDDPGDDEQTASRSVQACPEL